MKFPIISFAFCKALSLLSLSNVSVSKSNILLIVKNNGFEVKNIYNLYLSDSDNKDILEAKNLANMLGAKFEITTLENEGMQYSLNIKI